MTIANEQYIQMMLQRRTKNAAHIAASTAHWGEHDAMQDFDVDLTSDPVVVAVAKRMVSQLEQNDVKNLPAPAELLQFENERAARIPPDVYAAGLVEYAGCSPSCLAQGLLYIERIEARTSGAVLTSKNMERLFFVAVMAASKITEDMRFSNRWWSTVGCVPLKELNQLEVAFISLLDWDLQVTTEDYSAFCSSSLGLPREVVLDCDALELDEEVKQVSPAERRNSIIRTASRASSSETLSPHLERAMSAKFARTESIRRKRSSFCLDLDFEIVDEIPVTSPHAPSPTRIRRRSSIEFSGILTPSAALARLLNREKPLLASSSPRHFGEDAPQGERAGSGSSLSRTSSTPLWTMHEETHTEPPAKAAAPAPAPPPPTPAPPAPPAACTSPPAATAATATPVCPAPEATAPAPRRMPGRKFGFPPKDFSNVGPSPMSVSARRAHEESMSVR